MRIIGVSTFARILNGHNEGSRYCFHIISCKCRSRLILFKATFICLISFHISRFNFPPKRKNIPWYKRKPHYIICFNNSQWFLSCTKVMVLVETQNLKKHSQYQVNRLKEGWLTATSFKNKLFPGKTRWLYKNDVSFTLSLCHSHNLQ